jgi:signal transduction histidine kinase/DNA-binding response OmpR family regulator
MSAPAVRVLLVEDDQDHAEIIRRTLGRQDPPIAVSIVSGGAECLSALEREVPSAILLDYSLPGMSGLDVLARIREAHLSVPVIMVTGQGDERVAVKAMKAGAADYLLKTSGYAAALPTVLQKVLKQHALARENERLYEETQRQLAESQALVELSKTLTSTLEYQPLLTAVVGAAARACAMDLGAIFLWEDGRLVTVVSRAAEPEGSAGAPLDDLVGCPLDRVRLLDQVASRREVIVIDEPGADSRVADVPALAAGGAVMALPLFRQTEVFGALVLHSARPKPPVTPEQKRFGSTVAAQVSLAVENARLYQATEQALADLQAAQEELVRGATLRALGEMASGASHHLNNLLAVILGRAQLALSNPAIGQFRRPLEVIERATRDGADVVRRIQEFARMKPLDARDPEDLNQLVGEVVQTTTARWSDAARARGVSIVCEPGNIPFVDGHAPSLREMLASLLTNAVDALPDGGRVTIRTWAGGESVFLSVSDGGVGMTEEVRQRAQEPFFTTKGPKSTGLGLSVSGSIAKRHGGDLTIESALGQGTTVTVRLGGARSDPLAAGASPGESVRPLSLLVLDDEDEVREVIALLVEADGHIVRQARVPSEALALLADGPLPDVVLSDLGMPEMTGWEVARAVKARWPAVTVGLVTGWGDHLPPSAEAGVAVDFVLRKPIDRNEVRECLSRAVRRQPGSELATT